MPRKKSNQSAINATKREAEAKVTAERQRSETQIKGMKQSADEKIAKEKSKCLDTVRKERQKADDRIVEERTKSAAAIRKERQHFTRSQNQQSEKIEKKHAAQLESEKKSHADELLALKNNFDRTKKQLQKKLNSAMEQVVKEREMWDCLSTQLKAQVDSAEEELQSQKAKHRQLIQQQLEKTQTKVAEMQVLIDNLKETNFVLSDKLKQAERTARQQKKYKEYWKDLAKRNIAKYKESQDEVFSLRDIIIELEKEVCELEDTAESRVKEELAQLQAVVDKQNELIAQYKVDKRELKKHKVKGKRGGGGKWDLWVVQLCCELLVIGAPPSTIPKSIATIYETLYGTAPDDTPSVSFVRQCRIYIQIIGETCVAIKLTEAEFWHQTNMDATTRRHIPFNAIVIGLLTQDFVMENVIMSSCIILKDESSATTAKTLWDMIELLRHRLTRLRETLARDSPEHLHCVPEPATLDQYKEKMQNTVLTSDSCNAALKERRIIKVDIGFGTVRELDCHNHMRNIFLCKATSIALSSYLSVLLQDSLNEIDPSLRVRAPHAPLAIAFGKLFSRTANYVKGDGHHWEGWFKENYPGGALYPIGTTHGTRQDVIFIYSLGMYMNRVFCCEYLDHILRNPDKSDNILRRNVFVCLTSEEIIAQLRLLVIMHVSLMIPMRWLAGTSHQHGKDHNWGAAHMTWVVQIFYDKMKTLVATPDLIVSETFMMNIFNDVKMILPPFGEYLDHMFKKKKMRLVARGSLARVMPLSMAREEAFHPKDDTNKGTTARVIELFSEVGKGILASMESKKSAVNKYLNISDSDICWKNMTEEYKLSMRGIRATNDAAESALGAATRNVQKSNRIDLKKASVEADAKRNGWFDRPLPNKKGSEKKKGLFLQFDQAVSNGIMVTAIEDAPATLAANNAELEFQQQELVRKEKLAQEKEWKSASAELLDAGMYHRMYDSDACWKGDPKIVNQNLKKIKGEPAQREALLINIKIRVRGFGWKQWHITATHKRKKRPIKELSQRLREIIKFENSGKEGSEIPSEPPTKAPKRREVPVLGTITDQRRQLDLKHFKDEEKLREAVKKLAVERKARKKRDDNVYDSYQPWFPPKIADMENKRIDVYYPIKDSSNKKRAEKQWCQGKVTKIVTRKPPVVEVQWDPTPDIEGFEQSTVSEVELLPEKWKSRKAFGWRLDLDMELYENVFDSDDEDAVEESDCEDEVLVDDESSSDEDDDGNDDNIYTMEDSESESDDEK